MIYLVSKQESLFSPENYTFCSVEEALKLLEPLDIVSADTETQGLDPYTKKLLSVQLGNFDFQIVIDCTTIDIHLFKDYLESNRTFIFWNACFDLKFLYHQGIYPKKVYDGFLAEKLLYLGYPAGVHEYSLKSAGYRYCNIKLDKSVRGQIITKGLTEQVIVYAANDVKYEGPIREKQLELISKKGLEVALKLENSFVKCLAYIEYCGAHLDIEKWKEKMRNDQLRMDNAEKELNEFVVNYYKTNKTDDKSLYITKKTLIQILWNDKDTEDFEYCGNPEKLEYITREDGLGTNVYGIFKYPFPFIYQDLQGDLFAGFNSDYQCLINWNSQPQVIPFLKLLGINVKAFDPKEKREKDSINAKLLEPQVKDFPFLKIFLKYKEAQKVCSTYGQNWLDAINPVTGRVHFDFHQLGADTGRLSSGGGEYKLNAQNLPKGAETRGCFTAEPGNSWISCDYSGQESVLIASISNDKMLQKFMLEGTDMHSYVAKLSWPSVLKDVKLSDIKENFKDMRQDAKSIEFAINYGGKAKVIAFSHNIPFEEAEQIYNSYMAEFKGLAAYQAFRRQDFKNKGYILMSSVTGHKKFIYDWENISKQLNERKSREYWTAYNKAKEVGNTEFLNKHKEFNKLIEELEKQSINYPIQNAGALCFKFASIKFFNYLKKNNLLGKVKYCIPVHDEINVEAPSDIAQNLAQVLLKCMEDGAKPFCTKLKLTADPVVADHWVH